jgi:hypothetical protein
VIDTGAMAPTLTQAAIEHCGIAAVSSEGFAIGVGGRIPLMQATNVEVRLPQGVTFHWSTIPVLPKFEGPPPDSTEVFFGIIDYGTFAARGAVMDMRRKTITLTK